MTRARAVVESAGARSPRAVSTPGAVTRTGPVPADGVALVGDDFLIFSVGWVFLLSE